MTLRTFLFGPALLLCLAVNGLAASDWLSLKSTNFDLKGEVTEAELRMVAQRLEQFRDVFTQLFPQFDQAGRSRANVIIFRDPESFRPFKPRRPDGTADDGIAGYFLSGENVNNIALAISGGKSDPFDTIFHEYIHFLLKSRTGKNDLPPWLAEGLAQYFETLRVTPDNKAVIGSPPQGRLSTIRNGQMLADSDLLSAARTTVHGGVNIQRSVFYAQSWLLVHYLLNYGDGKPQERLERFLQLIRQSTSTDTALKQIYGIAPGQIGVTLRTYLQLPSLPTSVEPLSFRLPSTGESAAVKVPPVLVQAYLGDLLLRLDRRDEAETFLRNAIAADARSGPANASLGELLIRREKWDEASKHLEVAVSTGSADYVAHFNYSYALSRAGSPGGMVSRFAPALFTRMSESLKRSIELRPDFVQSYRILAFINLVNNENLPEAVSLLEKGLSLSPGDENFEVLLAKVLVRMDKYDDARKYAEKLSQNARDPEVKSDAAEILASINQYSKTKLQIAVTPTSRSLPWSPSLVLLKRSWVSPSDIEAIERERNNINLNRMLERQRPDETRVLGTIEKVECVEGGIRYNVRSNGKDLLLFGERFDNLRMAVLVAGENSYSVDCGVKLPSNPAVLSFTTPSAQTREKRPILRSITFVPEEFRLKSPEELAASRHVVVENDVSKRVAGASDLLEHGPADMERRWLAIRADLRPLKPGEMRAGGTLESIDCIGDGFAANAVLDGKRYRLIASPDITPKWFGVEATQVSLGCGSVPGATNVLFTYRLAEADGTAAYNLVGLEFLPAGFPMASVTRPAP